MFAHLASHDDVAKNGSGLGVWKNGAEAEQDFVVAITAVAHSAERLPACKVHHMVSLLVDEDPADAHMLAEHSPEPVAITACLRSRKRFRVDCC